MPLTPTEEMEDDPLAGPEGLPMIFPNKDALSHDLQWLGRSIFFQVINGTMTHFTKYRIRRHIADQIRIKDRTLIIIDVDERNAHYILICPDEITKIRALSLGAITIEPPVHKMSVLDIRLTRWSTFHEREFLPLTHRARIRFHRVPLNLWNSADIHTLIARFEFPLAIAPCFSNQNYDTLRILIACRAPKTIPRLLWLSVEPIFKIVDVEIKGWDNEPDGPLPPDDAESIVQG